MTNTQKTEKKRGRKPRALVQHSDGGAYGVTEPLGPTSVWQNCAVVVQAGTV